MNLSNEENSIIGDAILETSANLNNNDQIQPLIHIGQSVPFVVTPVTFDSIEQLIAMHLPPRFSPTVMRHNDMPTDQIMDQQAQPAVVPNGPIDPVLN